MENRVYTDHSTFLVRTPIEPGESLHSLLIRLSRLNDYDVPDTLFQIALQGVNKPGNLKDRVALPCKIELYQQLETLTCLSIPDLYGASAHRFTTTLTPPDISIEFLKLSAGISMPLLPWSLATKQLRPANAGQFCPLCLRDAPYHRLIWLPIAVSACLEHSCLLVNRCQRCEKKVSIREIVETQCRKCKGSLAESEVLLLGNDAGLGSQRIIQSWLLNNMAPDIAPLLFEAQPRVLYRLLDGLQWATRMLAPTNWPYMYDIQPRLSERERSQEIGLRNITPYESYCLYSTACKGMMNWPNGFWDFLDAYRSQLQQSNQRHKGPKSDLGTLYTQWLQEYWQHPAFDFVHQAFEQYFSKTYALSNAVMRTSLLHQNADLANRLPYVNIAEAARLLDTTPKIIDRMITNGWLVNHGTENDRRNKLIYREDIAALQAKRRELVTREVAAEWLGVTERMIVDLVYIGLLVAEYNPAQGFAHWMFSHEALMACMEKVAQHVEDYHKGTNARDKQLLSLAEASRLLFVIGSNASSILLLVSEGKLHAYHPTDRTLSFETLFFDRADIDAHIETHKRENGWISREELTRILHVKDTTLTKWVRSGLIVPSTIIANTQFFNHSDVIRFMAEYVTSEKAAELLRVDKLTVQKWARTGRLADACVSGPTVNDCHTYLFHKERLIQWRSERLTFGEAAQLLGVSKATLHRWTTEGKIEVLDDMQGKQRWFSREKVLSS